MLNQSKQFLDAIGWNVEKTVNLECIFYLMELPIDLNELDVIIESVSDVDTELSRSTKIS